MNKKYVYLAGPIEGNTIDQIHGWRNRVANEVDENIGTINPYRGAEKLNKTGAYSDRISKAIHDKNLMDSKTCDLMIANMPDDLISKRPSIGTIYELAWFDMMNKPIILVSTNQQLITHPLVVSSVGWVYDNIDEAIDTTNSLLGVYK